jgi:hypothetical protein
MYEFHIGPIPRGKVYVCHHCDYKRCIRPEHLYIGTVQQNTADALERKRFWNNTGVNSRIAKLTDDAVRTIRQSSKLNRELAAEFGVSLTTISDVKNRLRWKHVTD